MKLFLKAANGLISIITAVSLCAMGVYAIYALWDNHRIYAAAENVQADMIQKKPVPEEDGASFEELLKINGDVCAWLTLDNTGVDYPVVQGETNLTYINRDVYGDFALAGSIYLDSRNENGFSENYSLLYGHHMENGSMFGDLHLYKEKEFFEKNKTGTLILPEKTYALEIFACLLVNASDEVIFEPERWRADTEKLISYAEERAENVRREAVECKDGGQNPKILALSTCSSEFTDARTVVLAVMKPYETAGQEEG